MCTLVLAHRCLSGAPLAVAANRDEWLDRPASPPRVVPGSPRVLMPRDDVAHGTWLGLNEHGLFVGITNRAGAPPDPSRLSRGSLVVDALRAPDAKALHRVLAALQPRSYNPFHLLYADGRSAFVTWCDGERTQQQVLEPGLHVITERSLGGDDRGRTERLVRLFEERIADRPPTLEALRSLLVVHGPQGEPLGGSCVHADERGYGTRSGFVYLAAARPAALWLEGHPCTAQAEDLGAMLGELGLAATPDRGSR